MRPGCPLPNSVSAPELSGCRRGIPQWYSVRAPPIQVLVAATPNLADAISCGRRIGAGPGSGKNCPHHSLSHASHGNVERGKARTAASRKIDRFRRTSPMFQCLGSTMATPRFSRVRPEAWASLVRCILRKLPSPADGTWSSDQVVSRCRRSQAAGSRTTPAHPLRLSRFGTECWHPRTGDLRLRAFGTQAGTRFISSFQRWQATSCPSSVSSVGS